MSEKNSATAAARVEQARVYNAHRTNAENAAHHLADWQRRAVALLAETPNRTSAWFDERDALLAEAAGDASTDPAIPASARQVAPSSTR